MTIYLYIGGIIVCLLCSALFSATEMAYSSCNLMRLEKQSEEGNKRAKLASYIVKNYDNALSTILIGNNLANIAGSSIASLCLMAILGQELGEKYAWVSTLVMTLLVIIFGETIPKITAKKNANRFALSFARVIRFLMILLFPIVWIIVMLIRLLTLPFKGSKRAEDADEAVEELQNIIETAEDEDVLDEERSELVRSAIDFSDIAAYEVMTARVDMYAIDIDDDFDEILKKVENSPYSRVPVYRNGKDDIIGILYLNQFLKALTDDSKADIEKLLMKPIYVYKTMRLPDILAKLRKEKQHLAIVSDEYGGVLGVVSMEDVLEQIVGDIWDETDTVETEYIQKSEDEFEVDGDMMISDFLELVGIREDDFDVESETVGGWTNEELRDFAKVGDRFTHDNLEVEVLSVDGRRVEKVQIKVIKEE